MHPQNSPFDCTYAARDICTGSEWKIFQHIDRGIALCSPEGQILEKLNPAFASLHGYAVEELTGKGAIELVAPDCRANVVEWLQRADALNNYSGKSRHLRADGTTFPVLVQVKTLKNESGNIEYYLVTVEDITERQQTEELLREQQAQVRWLFESHPQPMWIYELESLAFLAVNQAAIARYGYSEAEFLSMTIADLCPQENVAALENSPAIAGLELPNVGRYRLKDGTKICPEIASHPINFEGRSAQLVLANNIPLSGREITEKNIEEKAVLPSQNQIASPDISDCFLVEAALRESEEKFRQFAETISNVFWMTTPARDRILYVSPAYETIWGRTCASLYEQPQAWLEAIHPDDREGLLAQIEEEIRIGYPQNCPKDYRIVKPNGDICYIRDRSFPIRNQSGEVYRIVGIAEDVTLETLQLNSLIETEEALQKLNEELEIRVEQRTHALQQSHEKLSGQMQQNIEIWQHYYRIIDNLKEVVFETDEMGIFIMLNPAWKRITRFCISESIGKNLLDYIHAEDVQKNQKQFQLLIDRQQDYCCCQSRFLTKDGGFRWIEVFAQLILDFRGTIVGIAGTLNDVTDRKTAELALRESEARFRSLFEQAAVGVAQVGLNLKWLLVNQKLCDILGYNCDELLGRTCLEITHDEDLAAVRECLRSIVADEIQTFSIEKRFICKDNSVIWVNSTTSLVRASSGEPKYFIQVVENITRRKHAEEKLRKSEANLAEAQKIVHLGNWEFDLATRSLTWSEETFHIFGFDPKQKEPDLAEVIRLIHPLDRDKFPTNMKQAIRDGNCEIEFRIVRPDGSLRYAYARRQVVYNYLGQIARLFGIVQDITDRKLAEEALRTTQERFQYLISSSPATIYTCRPDGDYLTTFVSENVSENLGYTPDDFLADPRFWIERIHSEDIRDRLARLSRLFEEERQTNEYRFLNADGTYRWLRDEVKLVRDETGVPWEFIGSIIDISDRKKAEEEVLKTLAKEKELSELKSRFVSMTSHEFRTPLAIIQSSAQLLERYDWTREEQLEQLQQIQSAVKQMTDLLEDILTIGKAESGKLEFSPAPIELIEFCRRLMSEMQHQAGSEHQINFMVESSLPLGFGGKMLSSEPLVQAQIDEKLLRQILSNLISNAMKYSPEGGMIQVTLTFELPRGIAIFRIQDWGIGIPTDGLSHLFESFYRARNVGTIPGTGLGLAIVKKCVDLHGGTISVASQVGVGTTFKVSLPLYRQEKNEENFSNRRRTSSS